MLEVPEMAKREGMLLLVAAAVFGLAQFAESSHPCDTITGSYEDWKDSVTATKDVVVVGGGAAGLEALRHLLNNGVPNSVLLEAQDYLGGRVRTYRQGNILVEDGAEWIHASRRNPITAVAESLGELTDPLDDNAYETMYKKDNGDDASLLGFDAAKRLLEVCERNRIQKKYHGQYYGKCYEERFDKIYKREKAPSDEKAGWRHYAEMATVKDLGVPWTEVSMRDADQFTDWGRDQWIQWKSGFDNLIDSILDRTQWTNMAEQVKTNSPVCKIFYKEDPDGRALVVTQGGEVYLTDFVIYTPSIGYLKKHHLQTFVPPLPQKYQNYIDWMVLGVANKVQIGWDSPWWGADKPLELNLVFTEELDQSIAGTDKEWIYGVMEALSIHQQQNLLQVFVGGTYGEMLENRTDDEVKADIMELLAQFTEMTVPDCTFFRMTRWLADHWFYGSYNSYITMEGDRNKFRNRSPLKKPIKGKFHKIIYLAGEHISKKRYGTVDGAMVSGQNAAKSVIKVLNKLTKRGRKLSLHAKNNL